VQLRRLGNPITRLQSQFYHQIPTVMFIRFFLVVLSCVSVMAVIAQVGGCACTGSGGICIYTPHPRAPHGRGPASPARTHPLDRDCPRQFFPGPLFHSRFPEWRQPPGRLVGRPFGSRWFWLPRLSSPPFSSQPIIQFPCFAL
jgi:hypothetical protein